MQFFLARSFVCSFAFIYFDVFFINIVNFVSMLFQIVFFGIRFRGYDYDNVRTNDDDEHCLLTVKCIDNLMLCPNNTMLKSSSSSGSTYSIPLGLRIMCVNVFFSRSPNIGMRILYLSLLCVFRYQYVLLRLLFAQSIIQTQHAIPALTTIDWVYTMCSVWIPKKARIHSAIFFSFIHSSDNGLGSHDMMSLMFPIQTMCTPFICVFFWYMFHVEEESTEKNKNAKNQDKWEKKKEKEPIIKICVQAFSFWSLFGSVPSSFFRFISLSHQPTTSIYSNGLFSHSFCLPFRPSLSWLYSFIQMLCCSVHLAQTTKIQRHDNKEIK